jgi:hypothetical protein
MFSGQISLLAPAISFLTSRCFIPANPRDQAKLKEQ